MINIAKHEQNWKVIKWSNTNGNKNNCLQWKSSLLFGHDYVKLVRQVQNEEKTLAKMEGGGFGKKIVKDKVFTFKFIDVGKLSPLII